MLAKKFALGFGIAVILPFLVFYGVCSFSPQPKYEDYSVKDYYERSQNATPAEKEKLRQEQDALTTLRTSKEKVFERNLFAVSAPVGLAAIIVGSFLPVVAVGTGLMFGGIFTFLEGVTCYWQYLQDWMKFLLLLVTFIVLIVIGYRKLSGKPADIKVDGKAN